ncbi:MAG: C69 family dipeptidase [Candidatus Saganbacteria bacterium]|nr:C69 family dipeptidase [Candidatus Saganbacteria bacterium]
MFKKIASLLVIAALLISVSSTALACTTTIVGKDATTDGSVFVSHSDDDELYDQRIIYIPAMDYPPGSQRPVFVENKHYPRYVGSAKGPNYELAGYPETPPIGYIPQVAHTYAYFDANYGIMNEHQLSIGECTDGAKFQPDAQAGKRIMYSTQLSRIALERCTNARDAIKLMGKLIDDYGYFSTGETLLVGDTQEAWVMEICATPDEYPDLWVAKRVPDAEFFVAANEFRIREVDPSDPDIISSKTLFSTCQDLDWWDPEDGSFDWLEAVSYGEYNHPYYSLRRVWRVLDRVAPSKNFSPWVKDGYTKEYPFSVKPDKKLSVRDVMSLHRDHYEGTQFDLTRGIAAGPFGTPNRYIGPYDGSQNDPSKDTKLFGAWERAISIFYCGYAYVLQTRGWLPDPIGGVAWVGLDAPYTTVYVPFYCGALDLPESYQTGDPQKYSKGCAWWAFNFVSNWADLKYSYMKKDILAKQKELEDQEFTMQPVVDKQALALYKKDPQKAREYLTNYGINNANNVVSEWWELAFYLLAKYTDGYVNIPNPATEVGYPKGWLDQVGYKNGPTTYTKPK